MKKFSRLASHVFASASFVFILLGALTLNHVAQASQTPPVGLVCTCTGCGAKAADGSCPGGCSNGAGCLSCFCSENGACPCSK